MDGYRRPHDYVQQDGEAVQPTFDDLRISDPVDGSNMRTIYVTLDPSMTVPGPFAPSSLQGPAGRNPGSGGLTNSAWLAANRTNWGPQQPMAGIDQGNDFSSPAGPCQPQHRQMASGAMQPDFSPASRFEGPRASHQPTYRTTALQDNMSSAGMAATAPGAIPARIFRTDKHTYEMLKPLGPLNEDGTAKGMSEGINLVRNKKTGRLFVEKQLAITTKGQKARAVAEVDALVQARDNGSPYSINLMFENYYDGRSTFCSLILEHCDGGTAEDILKWHRREKKQIPESLVWHIFAGISRAVHFCHAGIDADLPPKPEPKDWNTVCHLDIKPANIFFSTQQQRGQYHRVVVGDFGCSVSYKAIKAGKAERELQRQGTPGWFPPENTATDGGWTGRYGMPTDIWQMGGVIQTLCRLLLQPEMESVERNRACGVKYSIELNNVVTACMLVDPKKRPKSKDVVREVRRLMEGKGWVF